VCASTVCVLLDFGRSCVVFLGWFWFVGVSLSSLRADVLYWLWTIACDVLRPDFPYSKKKLNLINFDQNFE